MRAPQLRADLAPRQRGSVAIIVAIVLVCLVGLGVTWYLATRPAEDPNLGDSGERTTVEEVAPRIERERADVRIIVSGVESGVAEVVAFERRSGGAPTEPTERNTTNADHEVLLSLPIGSYQFVVRAPGCREATVDRAVSANMSPIEIALEPGLTLTGYVVDEHGARVGAADVWASPQRIERGSDPIMRVLALIDLDRGNVQTPIRTTASADGYFEFDSLEQRNYRLRASAPGHGEITVEEVDPAEGAIELKLRPAGLLSGEVLDYEQVGIAGATIEVAPVASTETDAIRLIFDQLRAPIGTTVSGDDGRFEFDRVALGGKYRIRVTAPGYQPRDFEQFQVDLTSPPLDVFLDEGHTITGVIRDPDGRLLPGARVRAEPKGAEDPLRPYRQGGWIETDELGTFTFDTLGIDDHVVIATHDSYGTVVRPQFPVDHRRLDMRLPLGRALSGFVKNERDEAPIAGAIVYAQDLYGLERSTITDPGGYYELFGVSTSKAGTASLRVEADGFVAHSEPNVATEEDRMAKMDFALTPTGTIRGVVRHPNGTPVERCVIGVKGRHADGEKVHSEPVYSGADGKFVIADVIPGTVFLYGIHGRFLTTTSKDFQLEPGQHVTDVEFEMLPGGQIRGVAVDKEGKPIAGAIVAAATETQVSQEIETLRHSLTGDDGSYFLHGLEPGPIVLIGEAQEYFRTEIRGIEAVAGRALTGIEVRLTRGAFVAGRVTDYEGLPVVGAKVTATDTSDGLRRVTASTDDSGRYRIDKLGEYPVMLKVVAKGYSEMRIDEQPVDQENVDFALSRNGRIEGWVVNTRGRPLVKFGVRPIINDVDGSRSLVGGGRGFTSRKGRFRIDNLPPGLYDIVVGAPGTTTATKSITVQENTTQNLGQFVVAEGGKLAGYVVDDETGEPIERVKVIVDGPRSNFLIQSPFKGSVPRAERLYGRQTDGEGRFMLKGLAEVEVPLRFQHYQYIDGLAELVPGINDYEIRLRRSGWIEGRVVDREGLGISGAGMSLNRGIEVLREIDSGAKGRFRFGGLEEGRYTVYVQLRDDKLDIAPRMFQVEVVSGEGTELEARIKLTPAEMEPARRRRDREVRGGRDGRGGRGGEVRGRDGRSGRDVRTPNGRRDPNRRSDPRSGGNRGGTSGARPSGNRGN